MNRFCKNLGRDNEGLFCIVKALEGYGCHCSYEEQDCHVVDNLQIQCGGKKIGEYECQDFEPADWLEIKLKTKPLEYCI